MRASRVAIVHTLALVGSLSAASARADVDLASKFLNQGSVANTRHNMTQRQASGGGPSGAVMDAYRNDYGEVCVYCHTPHGANADVQLPLWNRTIKATVYQTYDSLGTTTLTQPVGQPGRNSLSCLSCHDGQTAVDSIINMPGSGRYNPAQATTQNNAFLNAWNNTSGPDASVHLGLNSNQADGCLVCHAAGAGIVGAGAADFTVFAISTDLRNDHPVGISYPGTGPGVDFNTPNVTRGDLPRLGENRRQRILRRTADQLVQLHLPPLQHVEQSAERRELPELHFTRRGEHRIDRLAHGCVVAERCGDR